MSETIIIDIIFLVYMTAMTMATLICCRLLFKETISKEGVAKTVFPLYDALGPLQPYVRKLILSHTVGIFCVVVLCWVGQGGSFNPVFIPTVSLGMIILFSTILFSKQKAMRLMNSHLQMTLLIDLVVWVYAVITVFKPFYVVN